MKNILHVLVGDSPIGMPTAFASLRIKDEIKYKV